MSRSNENNEKTEQVENDIAEQIEETRREHEDMEVPPIQTAIELNGVPVEEDNEDKEDSKNTEEQEKDTSVGLVASPDGSEKSSAEVKHLSVPTTSERKPSRNLEDIDRTLDELQHLADDAFLTAQLAQGNQSKLFDKLFESSSVYLKKCETVPEDLTKQQFSDEDGILEEIEEAVRDAEEKQFEPNHVSVVLDTECSSDDDVISDRYLGLGKIDQLRQDESGNSLRMGGHRVRQRVSSNATLNDRRSIISGHERARSNDSRSTSVFSSSIASFRRPISHFSIDNSCFDINDAPTQRSLMCTPVEKMFVKNSRSAPEMRVHETKMHPFLPSPSPSNDATTTTSDPSVSSELSVEQPVQPAVANLKLRLNEGLMETVSPVASPVVKPKSRKEKKTNQQMLKGSASSPNMNSQNLIVNVMRPTDVEIEGDTPKPNSNRTFEVVSVSITGVEFVRRPKKSVYVMAKFDGKDVHRSSKLRRYAILRVLERRK
uniref:Non-specific serine/threonine protein kinase n=1 Tax=Caenorhabditis tropicalis TaxID=1561998 RepID=A0A1I7UAP5_9PELO